MDDPIADIRRRFPTSAGSSGPTSHPAGTVPFAARFAVPAPQAKHSKPPTRTTTCLPTTTGGDGNGVPPKPDDNVVPASD